MTTTAQTLLVGCGSHARVVLDLFRQAGRIDEIGGFLDAAQESEPGLQRIENWPVLGGLSFLEQSRAEGFTRAIVPLGDNQQRREITDRVVAAGLDLTSIVAPSAVIGEPVTIGKGTMICSGAVVITGSVIGSGVLINTGATVDHDGVIADFVHLCPGSNLAGRVEVGEGTLIGTGSSVIPGVRIGSSVTIGAGAAVLDHIPDGVTAVGVPARPVPTPESDG